MRPGLRGDAIGLLKIAHFRIGNGFVLSDNRGRLRYGVGISNFSGIQKFIYVGGICNRA